ncbi:hypothetical protein GCK72_022598 [Caenorhabditis remanei]|uniref:F-box associated domain-containing protein n=1 Tax=Caenorhabditis remanei TaxID=31234 RepID=A0A6A5FUG0_CAERE|nr:hypothetical protein GCK72_022598 [Caenorhabditis remanei]KAF1746145.1 hypothetical protein GCK72_022598 [Caenorhabditis remanei]
MPTESEECTLYCDEGKGEAILQTVHSFLLSFVGLKTEYELITHCNYIPRLTNIRSSQQCILDYKTAASQLSSFLSYSPFPEFLCLFATRGSNLENVPGLAETQVLNYWIDGSKGDEFLANFKGRELHVYKGELSDSTVIQFLNDWISNYGYQNLNVVCMTVDEECELHPEVIMSQCSFKQFHSMDTFPIYRRTQRLRILPLVLNSCDFSSQFYIVRKSDGYVASVKVESKSLTFTAWNMNEKQFLEKHANKMLQ